MLLQSSQNTSRIRRYPARGLPGHGRHDVALHEQVAVALSQASVGDVPYGVLEGQQLDDDDALADGAMRLLRHPRKVAVVTPRLLQPASALVGHLRRREYHRVRQL